MLLTRFSEGTQDRTGFRCSSLSFFCSGLRLFNFARPFGSPLGPGLSLANLPAPRPQDLDNLGRDGRRQGHADKDEALVDGVSECKLGCETCTCWREKFRVSVSKQECQWCNE